jgi:hypothetical protein
MTAVLTTIGLVLPSPSEAACKTNPSKLWLCRNSPAWADGYLVPPNVADECVENADKVKLIPVLQATRDTAISQRDTALKAVDSLKLSLGDQQRVINTLRGERAKLSVRVDNLSMELSNRLETWQVVLMVGGGVLLGSGIGFVAGKVL